MIDFPASPTNGQVFSAPNGVVYQYSTTYSSWLAQNPAPAIGGTGDFCAFTTAALGSAGNVVIAFPSVFSGNAGSWYNPANGRYTPPAGRYKLSTWWSCNYSGSAIQLAIDAIRKNGVAIPNTLSISGTIAANYNTAVNSEVIVDANGSDYFEVTAYASAWTAGRGWFMAFPLTGMGAGAGPYLPLAGGTLTGPLTGTTATFNGGGFNGALKVTTNDSIIGGLFAGATKGVRIVPNAAYTAIEGVDNTGVGSYQPLTISGSVVNIAAPLSGTTATLSTAIAAGSNDTTVPTTAWVRANVGGGGSGKLLQTVYNRTGTGGSGTTIIPFDTTIPQITEGDEYMTLAITPTSATSLLIIDVVWIGSSSAVNNMGVALFKDATASALTAAAATVTAANATVNIKFKYIMVSGSTTATTFRVRAGGGAAGTTSFNSGTTFGFVMCSSMTIQEVTP